MPKAVLVLAAALVLAGWPAAIYFFTQWRDLDVGLAVSQAARVKAENDMTRAQKDLEKVVESSGRLKEIEDRLRAAEKRNADLESDVQSKRGELTEIAGKIELRKAELAQLEARLSARQAGADQELDAEQETDENPDAKADEVAAAETEGSPSTASGGADDDPGPDAASAVSAEGTAAPEKSQGSAATGEGAVPEAQSAESKKPQEKKTGRLDEAKRRFDSIDQNGDGRIDQFEFDVKSILIHYRLDANQDDVLTIDETLLSQESFDKLDSDGDGKIAAEEFTKAFPLFDRGGKGFITYEDYLATIDTEED